MKNLLCWILAFVMAITAAYYQRKTGPTYPANATVTINGTSYSLKLKRSQTNTQPCNIGIEIPETFSGTVFYKRYPSVDEWTGTEMQRSGSVLTAVLPSQPAAGKMQYYISLSDKNGNIYNICKKKPVIIRFKGEVPALVMIPHILIMFIAMLLSSLAGIYGLTRNPKHKKYGFLTLAFLVAGGIILGPLVQFYAFGNFWTGIPFGWDLTDNKTLLAVLIWLVAVILNRRKDRPQLTVIAAVVLLVIYSIPHSLFGSQLDYSTHIVTQGFIINLSVCNDFFLT
jgi:hypothetical protein